MTATATPVSASWRWATAHGHLPRARHPYAGGGNPAAASPTCGYTYDRSSAGQPGGAYRVTVTITWDITWQGTGGAGGVLAPLQTVAAAEFRVAESQALNTQRRLTMAVLTRSRRSGRPRPSGQAPRRGRRRSVPLAAGGVVLVVVCALVFAEGWLQAGNRQPVLALAQPVAAGQVITAADLETVRVSAAGPVSLVAASRQAEVAGSTAAVSMPAGSLLAGSDIGTPPPVKGQVRLGVALKPGEYPPDLAAGQDVDVLATPASGTSGSSAGSGSARRAAGRPGGGAVGQPRLGGGRQRGDGGGASGVRRTPMPQVAAANAAGQIALATIPAGG